MAAAETYEITLCTTSPVVRVKGPGGRVYTTSPHALGVSLLSGVVEQEDNTPGEWHDYLHSHGIAIHKAGSRQLIVGTIPGKTRTIGSANITFPPLLGGINLTGGSLVRAVLFVADLSRQAGFSVTSQEPVLRSFPYGNVYNPSGRICWGTVSPRSIVSLATLEDLFFTTGFNADLVVPGYLPEGIGSLTGVRAATTLRPPIQAEYSVSIATAIRTLSREEE